MRQTIPTIIMVFLVVSTVAQDPFNKTIISQGKSTVKQFPEIISFFVEFELSDMDYDLCSNRALGKIDTFKTRLKENNIDEGIVKTATYSIQEIIDRNNNTREEIHLGYRARIPISAKLTANDPQANDLFELLRSTFKSEIRISFELSQDQKESARESLLNLAVSDAKSKAEILSESLGVKVGEVQKVMFGDPQVLRNFTGSHNDLRRESMQLTSSGSVSRSRITTLTPPEVSMAASVVLAYEILYE